MQQLVPDGRLLVDLKIGKHAGNLVHLLRTEEGAQGRFDPTFGSFMGILDGSGPPLPPPPIPVRRALNERTSTLDLSRPWEATVVWFLEALTMPHISGFGLRAEPGRSELDTVTITASEGSRCDVTAPSHGVRHVREKGQPIWSHVERAHSFWEAAGRPGWERFGLTVLPDQHIVWLDSASDSARWSLPASPANRDAAV